LSRVTEILKKLLRNVFGWALRSATARAEKIFSKKLFVPKQKYSEKDFLK